MPRAAAPWTWRRMLRDHFPGSQTELLTMLVIGTYMDKEGFAFPSQELIAKGSRSSVRTVRRHVEFAKKHGWIAVTLSGRTGQAWRHQCYQAAVPANLPMTDTDEAISDAVAAAAGQPEGPDTAMAAPSRQVASTTMEGPDTGGTKVRTNGTEGADKQAQRTGHSYGLLTPALRTPALRTHASEEGPLARTGATESLSGEKAKAEEPDPKVIAGAIANFKAGRGLPKKTDATIEAADRRWRIRAFVANQPQYETDHAYLAKAFHTTTQDVVQALTERWSKTETTTTVEGPPL